MSNSFNLSVPCSIVVFQYYKKHGFDMLFHNILRMVSEKEYRPAGDELPPKITHQLKVPVTADKLYQHGYQLNNRAVIQLNVILEAIMRDQVRKSFLDELASCRRSGVKLRIKPFIDDILIRMGLSEEAKSFDTVKKDLQRFCEAQKIDYKELKKVKKNVPKLRRDCVNCVTDGVPLSQFLKAKGICRKTFYNRYRGSMKTFFVKGVLYLHIENFSPEEVYFSEVG